MSTRYFEFSGDDDQRGSVGSSKFWEVTITENSVSVRFGKIGANGQTTLKSFTTPKEAQAEVDKLVASKVKKGYVEKTPA